MSRIRIEMDKDWLYRLVDSASYLDQQFPAVPVDHFERKRHIEAAFIYESLAALYEDSMPLIDGVDIHEREIDAVQDK